MGIFNRLKNIFLEESVLEEETQLKLEMNQNDNTNFISVEDEIELVDSLYGKIQLYKTDLDYIKTFLPEKAEELKTQLEDVEKLMETENDDSLLYIQKAFVDAELKYEEIKRMADGESVIRSLREQNSKMNEIFENSSSERKITQKLLEKYINEIKQIQEKAREVGGEPYNQMLPSRIQKAKFATDLLKAEYRLKMMELEFLYIEKDERQLNNPFENLSQTKQKMFMSFFNEDIKKITEKADNLAEKELLSISGEEISEYILNVNTLKEELTEENRTLENITYIVKLIQLKATVNLIPEQVKKIETQMQELEKKRQEQEELKELSNYDIDQELYKIAQNLTIGGNVFQNALDFQMKILQAKGLLENTKKIEDEKLECKVVDIITAYEIVKKAKEEGINCVVFPDAKDEKYQGKGCKIFISKKNKDILDAIPEVLIKEKTETVTMHKIGAYPATIINELYDMVKPGIKESIYGKNEGGIYGLYWYNVWLDKKSVEDEINSNLIGIKKGIQQKEYEDGTKKNCLCYISVPTTSNIVRCMEQFEEHGIQAFLEPDLDYSDIKKLDTINIYFKRDVLNILTVEREISPAIFWGTNTNWNRKIIEAFEWPEERVI